MTVLSDRITGLAIDDVADHRWLTDHSWSRPSWTVAELEAAKRGRTVSVVLPALNEEETVAGVVETITPLLGGLVDELIVLDSGSTDDTEIRAVAAGARVVSREVALPEVETQPGKGEVLWRSLAATTGDIVAFVDSDLLDLHPHGTYPCELGFVFAHPRLPPAILPSLPRRRSPRLAASI